MPVPVSDFGIDVQYYLIPPGSKTHRAALAYLEKAEDYVRRTESAVKQAGAVSAVQTNDCFDRRICGMNFDPDKEVPSGWRREDSGFYKPHLEKTFNLVADLNLPHLDDFAPDIFPEGARLGKLGDALVIAYPRFLSPSHPGEVLNLSQPLPRYKSPDRIGDAVQITEEQLAVYSRAASVQERKVFDLDHWRWTPGVIAEAVVFKTPERILTDNRKHWERSFG